MAFTIDQGPDMDRHQGIVDLTGTTLADMAMNYFQTSEQHDCWIRLFCAKSPDGWKAGALVLERIAAEGGIETTEQDEDAWETACALADTVTEQEVLDPDLSNERLIHRLLVRWMSVWALHARWLMAADATGQGSHPFWKHSPMTTSTTWSKMAPSR